MKTAEEQLRDDLSLAYHQDLPYEGGWETITTPTQDIENALGHLDKHLGSESAPDGFATLNAVHSYLERLLTEF